MSQLAECGGVLMRDCQVHRPRNEHEKQGAFEHSARNRLISMLERKTNPGGAVVKSLARGLVGTWFKSQ